MEIKAVSFDCYGTLIDWESGIADALSAWASRYGAPLARSELLAAFAEAEPVVQAANPDMPYPGVLRRVARRIGRKLELPVSDGEAAAFASSVGSWPPFSDTAEVLARLKSRFRLAVLSNVDRESFAATERALGVEFDRVCTAGDIGSYKPDPRNFRFLLAKLDELGIARGELLHAAQSLYHDIEPASALGIRTAWVDRYGGLAAGAARAPAGEVRPDITVKSLTELAHAIDRA